MKIAAVTSMFNPCGYKSRWATWTKFRTGLCIPLYAVELTYDQEPVCRDADVHIHLTQGDVLFQKERLLNIGIARAILDGFDYIAWLDADVLFDSRDWPQRSIAALQRHHVIQCCGRVVARFTDKNVQSLSAPARYMSSRTLEGHTGAAWAARASYLAAHPLYDVGIVGHGDRAMWMAWIARMHGLDVAKTKMFWLNQPIRRHWEKWVESLPKVSVGYIEGVATMLAHGPRWGRKYGPRTATLNTYEPERDVRVNDQGAWEFTGANEQLRLDVEAYMKGRREDD